MENIQKYGLEVWNRYNEKFTYKMKRIDDSVLSFEECEPFQETYAELCEMIENMWVVVDELNINKILNK